MPAMPSPTEKTRFPLAFEVRDTSVVDWDTLVIRVDGEDATSRFVHDGNMLKEISPEDYEMLYEMYGEQFPDWFAEAFRFFMR